MALTAERVRNLFDYDPATGEFVWRTGSQFHPNLAGSRADKRRRDGYSSVSIDGRKYLAHRLAWLHVHGEWPAQQIDHINMDRADNKLSNLRLANNAQNNANRRRQANNTSGVKGVTWHKTARKWMAVTKVAGQYKYLGLYATKDGARSAYDEAAVTFFGEFARCN